MQAIKNNQKWEYILLIWEEGVHPDEATLNNAGKDGWELVTVI